MVVNDSESKFREIWSHISTLQITEQQLQYMKTKYSPIIKSKRKCEQISSLIDLLHILEKRDALNPDKIDVFIEIAAQSNDSRLTNLITSYNSSTINNTMNNHNNIGYNPVINNEPPRIDDVQYRVYNCIAGIGQKWTDFARALGVPEGIIDNLHTRDFNSRVYEILKYHENNCDPRYRKSKLLDALTDARRNDLRKKVQEIFDMFENN